ncbi:hypothetical protein EJ03DRAFT_330787 [Teratosphaeria nubilosa]|uniref:Uncharacterized protein n=1 Tax=Teratosphaeria nubilosa TaxID=161662 RepID=A0A6G1KYC7_9PEZI|nr:hypothetical protein EJ03DRAFT_330787 [Teratosphaeria nubilosa]
MKPAAPTLLALAVLLLPFQCSAEKLRCAAFDLSTKKPDYQTGDYATVALCHNLLHNPNKGPKGLYCCELKDEASISAWKKICTGRCYQGKAECVSSTKGCELKKE